MAAPIGTAIVLAGTPWFAAKNKNRHTGKKNRPKNGSLEGPA